MSVTCGVCMIYDAKPRYVRNQDTSSSLCPEHKTRRISRRDINRVRKPTSSMHALKYMREGGSIINSTSVVAYSGSPDLLDYCATKGAIVAFTGGLALQLVQKGIRVNGVAAGPVWTPLQASTRPQEQVVKLGLEMKMGRAAQPYEIAPSYVFLASNESSYFTGQVLHPNGGMIVNT